MEKMGSRVLKIILMEAVRQTRADTINLVASMMMFSSLKCSFYLVEINLKNMV